MRDLRHPLEPIARIAEARNNPTLRVNAEVKLAHQLAKLG